MRTGTTWRGFERRIIGLLSVSSRRRTISIRKISNIRHENRAQKRKKMTYPEDNYGKVENVFS